jgi:hypothetical protein
MTEKSIATSAGSLAAAVTALVALVALGSSPALANSQMKVTHAPTPYPAEVYVAKTPATPAPEKSPEIQVAVMATSPSAASPTAPAPRRSVFYHR